MLRLNVPHWYKQPDFVAWLNKYTNPSPGNRRHATWHLGGEPGEYSDVFVIYDDGEGSDFEVMPEWAWEEIERICKWKGISHAVVWLLNLEIQ